MRRLRIHILQPTEASPPGAIDLWLQKKNHDVKVIRLFLGEKPPKVDETDWVIVMGGKMGVHEVVDYPWIDDVKKFLLECTRAQKTGLGICLGAQLYSVALGGKVKRNEHWEVGWHPIYFGASHAGSANAEGAIPKTTSKNSAEPTSEEAALKSQPKPGATLMVYQYHQDTFDLPSGAVRIATNEITKNQGFAVGDRIVALQFHPEATEEWIAEEFDAEDYPTGPHVQSVEETKAGMSALQPMRKWLFALLDRLESVASRA